MIRKIPGIKVIALLALSSGLVSCADYYDTGYRYPRTRSYTEINTYRYNRPPVVYPAPVYPAPPHPPTSFDSNNYSIHNEYEINRNYYPQPQNPYHDYHTDSDDDSRQNGYSRNPNTDDDQQPYSGRQRPFIGSDDNAETRYRGYRSNDDESSQPRGRTFGQQEYDKAMERFRQHKQDNIKQHPEQQADNPTPRFQPRHMQNTQPQQAPERQRPAALEKFRNRGAGNNRPSE